MKKISTLLLSSFCVFGLTTQVFAAEKSTTKPQANIEEIVVQEWKGEGKNPKVENELKKEIKSLAKSDKKGVLVHNNGKPIKTDIVQDGEDNKLFAVYTEDANGANYETYYFENTNEVNIEAIKEDTSTTELPSLEGDSGLSTQSIEIGDEPEKEYDLAGVKDVPSGGYYKTYKWTFKNSLGTIGVYTSVNHYDRASKSANIDGKTGSVWNVHAENNWNPSVYARLDQQRTRMSAAYSSQKLLSYGPKDDGGGSVNVSLSGILNPMSWNFDIGYFSLDDISSIANKYGRWEYNRNLGYADPFISEPGLRVSNTLGNLATQLSHTFIIGYQNHSTGIITVSLPDR